MLHLWPAARIIYLVLATDIQVESSCDTKAWASIITIPGSDVSTRYVPLSSIKNISSFSDTLYFRFRHQFSEAIIQIPVYQLRDDTPLPSVEVHVCDDCIVGIFLIDEDDSVSSKNLNFRVKICGSSESAVDATPGKECTESTSKVTGHDYDGFSLKRILTFTCLWMIGYFGARLMAHE